jgi:uncharacterized protein (DUF1778 family)
MAIPKLRDQIVVFRLTKEEYATLKAASAVRGARTISDFIRAEMLLAVQQERQPVCPLNGRLSEVNQKLAELESEMRRLSRILEGLSRPSPGETAEV